MEGPAHKFRWGERADQAGLSDNPERKNKRKCFIIAPCGVFPVNITVISVCCCGPPREQVCVGEGQGMLALVDNCLMGRPFYRRASEVAEAGGP